MDWASLGAQLRRKRPRTHQRKRGEGFPDMTKASRDTQGGRKVKRGKKERKKERGRERERREKEKAGVPSYEQSSRDTPKKETGDPEHSIQENTKKQRKKGGGKGNGGGTKLATGSNEPQKYFGRSDHVEALSQLRPLRPRKGMSQLGIPKMRQKSEFLWHEPATVRSGHVHLQAGEITTDTRSTGPREALYGSSRTGTGPDTLMESYGYAY